MRKIIKQLIPIIVLISTISVSGQSDEEFHKKWYLKGYIYLGLTFSQEDIEKNDYIYFKIDNTYTTVDEGIFSKGTWKWDHKKKIIYLKNKSSNESLPMKLIKLSKNQLIVLLEDGKDSIKVKFQAKK